jgi:hypothetical protein
MDLVEAGLNSPAAINRKDRLAILSPGNKTDKAPPNNQTFKSFAN